MVQVKLLLDCEIHLLQELPQTLMQLKQAFANAFKERVPKNFSLYFVSEVDLIPIETEDDYKAIVEVALKVGLKTLRFEAVKEVLPEYVYEEEKRPDEVVENPEGQERFILCPKCNGSGLIDFYTNHKMELKKMMKKYLKKKFKSLLKKQLKEEVDELFMEMELEKNYKMDEKSLEYEYRKTFSDANKEEEPLIEKSEKEESPMEEPLEEEQRKEEPQEEDEEKENLDYIEKFAYEYIKDLMKSVEEELERKECPHCHRKFTEEALEKHVKACEQVFLKKREVFDSKKMRLSDLPFEMEIESEKRDVLKMKRNAIVECPDCERKFFSQSFDKHAKVCKQVFLAKREPFDMKAKRILFPELQTKEPEMMEKMMREKRWKKDSETLRKVVRMAKQLKRMMKN